ncbi:MAG: hypothetical protein K8R86_12925 [Bacteroidales bacterium]|nr:hypothetical protein [Bacteroidales bacterium]
MQKRIAIIAVLLISYAATQLNAQDTIIFNSNQKTAVIIKEISDLEIRYKNFSNPDGPVYTTNRNSVYKIIFQNGEQEQISKKKHKEGYGRNIVNYHIFDLIYRDFSFSYEHILKNGKFGLKIPVAIGFNNTDYNNGPRQYSNLLYSGFGLNVYLLGQRMVSYFIGPEIHLGIGKDHYYYYDEYYYQSYDKTEDFVYGRFLINNGVSFNPIHNFRLAVVLGLGVRYYELEKSDNDDDGLRSTGYLTFSMGFRF